MNIGNYTKKLSDWMEYKRYSKESIKNYVSCITKFLHYFENEATKPSEISAEKIKYFLTQFKEPNTHKAYLCSIKLFYSKVGGQPDKLDKVEYPKSSKKLPIVLSIEEIQKMFDVCENKKHKIILLINNFLLYLYRFFTMKIFKIIPSFTLPIVTSVTSGEAFVFDGYFYYGK